MMKELHRQPGEVHVYIDKMYHRWQKAILCTSQMSKEFGAYLLYIRSNLFHFHIANTSNKT